MGAPADFSRAQMRGRSRCDICGRRIAPARYELGLCAHCESLVALERSYALTVALYRLLGDPERRSYVLQKIEQQSKAFAAALRECT